MALDAPGAETPWGVVSQGRFTARLSPAKDLSQAEFSLDAADTQTPWAAITNLHLTVRLASVAGDTNVIQADLALAAAQTRWASVTNLHLTARLASMASNTNVIQAQLSLAAGEARTPWGSATNAQLSAPMAARLCQPTTFAERARSLLAIQAGDHAPDYGALLSGQGEFTGDNLIAENRGKAAHVRLLAHVARPATTARLTIPWPIGLIFQPYAF